MLNYQRVTDLQIIWLLDHMSQKHEATANSVVLGRHEKGKSW